MGTVGQFTTSVAHDLNNLLMVITANLQQVQRQLGSHTSSLPEGTLQAIDNAMFGVQHAATLTQRLLAFSRRQPLLPKPVEVNRLVAGMAELLRCAMGESVELRSVLDDGLWQAEVEPGQLEAAILNLAVNARDAMPAGGQLTITTRNMRFEKRHVASPGEYVMICVADTGTGLAEEVLARVGEPFFTTKKEGKGTGLGLAQVNEFVRRSGGHVKIRTKLKSGTSVALYLPRVAGKVEAPLDAVGTAPSADCCYGIPLADDDEDVRPNRGAIQREVGHRALVVAGTDIAWQRSCDPKVLSISAHARNASDCAHDGHDYSQIANFPFTCVTPTAQLHKPPRVGGGPKWVLVVEDEAQLRKVVVQHLRDQGYEVAEAGSAVQALEQVRHAAPQFDAAIVDMGLPDRPGDALVAELRVQLPELPILIASGYGELALGELAGGGSIASLAKPYDLSSLQAALEVLFTHFVGLPLERDTRLLLRPIGPRDSANPYG